jgi:hypothetical protein
VEVALLVVALAVAECWRSRRILRGWLVTLVPVAASYGVVGRRNLEHPGALVARFNLISIGADHAPLLAVIGRFVGNYFTYFGPDFLFVEGDHRARHATQFGGMLLWITLPLVVAGLVAVWRKRDQPFMRFVFLGTLAAPVSAALTEESVPHALRASMMLPFLLVLAIEGMIMARELFGGWRRAAGFAVAAGLVVQGVLFTVDMYATWPARSALDFDAGEIDAITRASAMSDGTRLLLSDTLDQPYIQAAFIFRPQPPPVFTDDSVGPLLAEMNMVLIDPTASPAQPGAIAVLSSGDPVPPGAQRLFDEVTPAPSFAFGTTPVQHETIVVYRLR